ncbi:Bacterial SH3 domain protein [Roseivivax jejudonensis]|uniref:Bacterial SH3 domain protein n=1 Tax=Roseivivax jejudonensis TaxID=1529041 RepID=A0A1X6YD36_9RHOB|nr:SH3 domain-containing protein [Roseivivax jejudonensis]SLN17785.1 Bacterial SH3 domain protein [Roseivivax jejudonensis]
MTRFTLVLAAALASVATAFAAGPASAQEGAAVMPSDAPTLPALHAVTGVVPGDVLNVRAEPDPEAEKIGELAADAIGVEVTAIDAATGWARVNTNERAGWASLDFLSPEEGGALPDVARLSCFGTEPFWTLDVDAGGLSNFSEPESEALFLTGPVQTGEGRTGRYGVTGGAAGRQLALAITVTGCSDGMSDRLYGLDAALILGGSGSRMLSGCCSLETPD